MQNEIKANPLGAIELRLDNWVMSNKAHKIKSFDITNILRGWECYGIPLTPEILEKSGFEKDEEFCGFGINELMVVYSDGHITLMQDNFGKWFVSGMHMNHFHFESVHQLQNLYYALTNEELNI